MNEEPGLSEERKKSPVSLPASLSIRVLIVENRPEDSDLMVYELKRTGFDPNWRRVETDIATYPWVFRHEWYGVKLEAFPRVKRWFEEIGARPAVARGMAIPQQP